MKTLIVYHRGGGKSLGYPPNCFTTFKWAISNGAKAVEYDTVVSKDKDKWRMVVVESKLLKDNNLDIDNLSLEDIRKLDAGNIKYGQCDVALLKDILKFFESYNIAQQIHLKGNNPNTVTAIISEVENPEGKLITSFDLAVLNEIKNQKEALRVGWLVKLGIEGTGDLTKIVESSLGKLPEYSMKEISQIIKDAKLYRIDTIILCGPKVRDRDKDTIKKIQGEGFQVGIWGVGSNLDLARKLITFGINRFTIDNPEEL